MRENRTARNRFFWMLFCFLGVPGAVSTGALWADTVGTEVLTESVAPADRVPDTLDIETAVYVSLSNHPALKAQASRVRAAWERPKQAAALPDPMIMAGVDKLLLNGEAVDYMFQVTQSFPLSRIRKRRADVEAARARAEESGLGSLCLDRELSSRLAFLDVWEWDLVIEILEQSVKLAGASADVALARYSGGSGSQVDVLRATAERAGLEASLKVARENRISATAALLASMGISPAGGDPDGFRLDAPPEPESVPDLDALLKQAKTRRPELGGVRAAVEEAEAAGLVARAQYFPQAQVLSGYMLSSMEADSYQGMLGVSVPLWLGWRNRAASESAARAEASRLEVSNLLLEIEGEVVGLHSALRAALVSRDTLQEEVLPMVRAAADATFAAYAAGNADLVSLIDAEQALYRTQLEEERMRVDVCRRHARLIRAAAGGLTAARLRDHASGPLAGVESLGMEAGDPTGGR